MDGAPVRLIRSTRRRKTVSARWRDGRLHVSVPATLSAAGELRFVRDMIAATARPQAPMQDETLQRRAEDLAARLMGEGYEPGEVVWSTRMNHRWGSCTPDTRRIRISSELAQMPTWVLDGVIVHELAHLRHRTHGPQFRRAAALYPRMDEAMAYLAGVTFGRHRQSSAPGAHDDAGASFEDLADAVDGSGPH